MNRSAIRESPAVLARSVYAVAALAAQQRALEEGYLSIRTYNHAAHWLGRQGGFAAALTEKAEYSISSH